MPQRGGGDRPPTLWREGAVAPERGTPGRWRPWRSRVSQQRRVHLEATSPPQRGPPATGLRRACRFGSLSYRPTGRSDGTQAGSTARPTHATNLHGAQANPKTVPPPAHSVLGSAVPTGRSSPASVSADRFPYLRETPSGRPHLAVSGGGRRCDSSCPAPRLRIDIETVAKLLGAGERYVRRMARSHACRPMKMSQSVWFRPCPHAKVGRGAVPGRGVAGRWLKAS